MGATLAIMNASSVLGRDVIDALASDDRGWMSELRLFGAPEDTFVHFDGQDIDIRPFTVDAFKGVDIAIGGADREVAAGAVAVRVGAEAPVVLPELNAQAIDEHRGTVFVPDGPSAAIALTANALGDQLQRITATVLHPASILGPKAIEELYEQQLALFNRGPIPTDIIGDRLAYNVLQAGEGCDAAQALVRCRVDVASLMVPVFGGTTLVMNLWSAEPMDLEEVRRRLDTAVGLELWDEAQPAEIVGESNVRVSLAADLAHPARVVAAVDEVRRSAVSLVAAAREIVAQDAF